VSVDFTEGRLATRNDPRNPWTGRNMLPHFIELNNRVMEPVHRRGADQIGIHTCPGGDRDSVHSADVPYSDLLPSMFGINAGYFLIQLASERDKDPVYQLIGDNLRDDANGVTQMAYVGVINPLNPRVESPEEVRDALVRAANFIPKEQLGSTDDCGFSPFSIDEKPSHGSPDFARETAWQKITNRVRGPSSPPRSSASAEGPSGRGARTSRRGHPPLRRLAIRRARVSRSSPISLAARRGRDVALMSRHDGALHEDMPFARERIGTSLMPACGGELRDIASDIRQMPDGGLVDGMLPVVDLDHCRQEGAALEVRLAEPVREHVEYRQQLLAGSFDRVGALGLQPLVRP
jgi:hypothetical protein